MHCNKKNEYFRVQVLVEEGGFTFTAGKAPGGLPFPRGAAAAACAKNVPPAHFLNAAGIRTHRRFR